MKTSLSKGNCLKGFEVKVEVELKSGARTETHTLLYSGIYVGIVRMNKRDMLVLREANHRNLARVDIKPNAERLILGIESKLCFIDQEKIISIDVIDEKFNLDDVDISSGLI